jgi:hypothetical protein
VIFSRRRSISPTLFRAGRYLIGYGGGLFCGRHAHRRAWR